MDSLPKKISTVDTIGSSVSEPSAEFRVEVSSEGTAIERGPPNLFEVYVRMTDQSKASQDDQGPAEVIPTPVVNEEYRPLFEAAQKGDWKTVEKIVNEDREAMMAKVMTVNEKAITVLDVAIGASQDQLVKKLIERVPPKYKDFSTSLESAAFEGRIQMVKALGKKVDAESKSVWKALRIATTYAPKQNEVIWHLAKLTKSAPTDDTMCLLVEAGHLDIALYLADHYQSSVTLTEKCRILESLAKMESNFFSGARLNFWEKSIIKFIGIPLCLVDIPFDNSQETKMAQATKWFKISLSNYATKPAFFIKRIGLMHKCSLAFANLVLKEMKEMIHMEKPEILEHLLKIVYEAASHGISEIVKLCLEHFPELMWNKQFTEKVMEKVVNGRHVDLFRLVNSSSTFPFLTDDIRKTLLKKVVEQSPSYQPADVAGAPFLMQRELQWFKVLEAKSDPYSKREKLQKMLIDSIDPTSKSQNWDAFAKTREPLLQEARQWMKDTSSSCILVATLIITVTFAGVFTVPGGASTSPRETNTTSTSLGETNTTATREYVETILGNDAFMVYAIADALALFSSVTAALMFLGVLTSRYLAEDFLISLPTKIILGLTFLFLSLTFMLVSFSSALTLFLKDESEWIYAPITSLAAGPIVVSAIVHLRLYFEMIVSTYWPRLYRPLKLWK